MTKLVGFAMLLAAFAATPPGARPQSIRDAGLAATGTAEVRGVVIDRQAGQPIRRAHVTLSSTVAQPPPVTVSTDDLGRFTFLRVVAGKYRLQVSVVSYVEADFGAAFDVASGATLSSFVISLTRSAVIGGVILDPAGEPVIGAMVRLLRRGFSRAGERTIVDAEIGGMTDDRGRYRVRGLAPGEYFVSTDGEKLSAEGSGSNPARNQDVIALRHADIVAARRSAPEIALAPVTAPPVMANTYYPGVTRASEALSIVVRSGDERTDIDFTLQPDRVAKIAGNVVMPAGGYPGRTSLELRESDFTRYRHFSVGMSDAVFEIASVPPGDYILSGFMRIGEPPSVPPGAEADRAGMLFGAVAVRVNGRDVSGVTLQMLPGTTISGRVRVAGALPPSGAMDGLRIGLERASLADTGAEDAQPVPIDATGAFRFAGVPQGRYVLVAATSGRGTWFVTSAIVNGRSVTDAPFDVESGVAIEDVTLTLTDRPAEVSGTVSTAGGTPLPEGRWALMWPTDRAAWRPDSRRIAIVRVAADGAFRFTRLPPGAYFLALIGEPEPGELLSAGFLDRLVASSPIRVTIADGEKKIQDLVIR